MTEVQGYTVKLRGKGLRAGRKGHDIVFVWRGAAPDEVSARARALEDVGPAWAACVYGRTGAPPEAPFMALKDEAACDPYGFPDDTVALYWHFKGSALSRLPDRARMRRATRGEFEEIAREVGMSDPAIRAMAIAGLPAMATIYATSRDDEEGSLVQAYQDESASEPAPAPAASLATLRALCALAAMNTHLDEWDAPKRNVAAQPAFAIGSASLRATIARSGAPNPARAAGLLIGAGLGGLADAIRAQARSMAAA